MTYMQRVIKVSDATYATVTAAREQLSAARQRKVTYAETIEEMAKQWLLTSQLPAEARKGGI